MEFLEKLNPMQREAVNIIEGPLLILAGAGSGKTSTITSRIAYMINQGINPFNIMALTFTNKAAKEMKDRVKKIANSGNEVWISTFHSTCVRILRRHIQHLNYGNNFTIYDADDAERLLKSCIKDVNLDEKQFSARGVMSEISKQKDELVSPTEFTRIAQSNFRQSQIAKVYELYQKRLKANNALDFDDLIFKTVELFTLRPDVLNMFQDRYIYIMIDEYQDTNTSQYRLVRLLSAKNKNLCVVGDDDQSIYGWRGANIRNILDFELDFPNAKVIKLEQNYRSTKTILNAANQVIKNNYGRKDKKLWTENQEGTCIKIFKGVTEYEEGSFIAKRISDSILENKNYNDFAILYRTNSQSRVLEEELIRKSIPYKIFGGVNFYSRREIKDMLAYLKIIYNPNDNISVQRIINVPRRGIGATTIEKIATYAENEEMSFYKALYDFEFINTLSSRASKLLEFRALIESLVEFSKTHTVFELMQEILVFTGYLVELKIENTDEANNRIDNIEELLSKAIDFEKKTDTPTLEAFLEDVSLIADIDNYSEDAQSVTLMTLHSSKGLEFPYVFLAGFEDGIFPSFRSITSESPIALEEERRLCYVGITRAKEVLYITAANSRRQNGQMVYNSISRFLREIPKDLIENEGRSTLKSNINSVNVKFIENMNKTKYIPVVQSLPKKNPDLMPKDIKLDFAVGDRVAQFKYGSGIVKDIRPAGADFEIQVEFESFGVKKFMARLSKLKKL